MNFYYEAVSVLEQLDAKRGSIKGIIGSLPDKSKRRTAALVIDTLKYKFALSTVIDTAALLMHERKHIPSKNLALLLVHDLLFARGGIQASDGPTKQAVLRHKTRLQAELAKLKIKQGVRSNQELASQGDDRAAQIPRYVRINTVKWSVEEAVTYLNSKGFSNTPSPFDTRTSYAMDNHVPGLLAFHPTATFHEEPSYHSGKLILQDKASCFPALVLSPDPHESTVALDATAAPGNKTTHLSAIMQNKGKILAFERDRRRFATLKSMIAKAGCRNVETFNLDFLSTNPQEARYGEVSHILLDPSCSGSGIVNRLDHLLEMDRENDESQEERLSKLATFQFMMIRHAMKFPRAVKIVYSTCSIHAAENEQVVAQALNSEEARTAGFTVASRAEVMPAWERRGLAKDLGHHSALAESLLRCSPGEDGTNGFFVSCFVRKPPYLSGLIGCSSKRQAHDEQSGESGVDGGTNSEDRKERKRKKRRKSKHKPT